MRLSPRLVLNSIILFSLALAGLAGAQDGSCGGAGVTWLLNVLKRIAGFLAGLLVVVSVIVIIIAAYNFLTSGGSEEKVTSAKQSIIRGHCRYYRGRRFLHSTHYSGYSWFWRSGLSSAVVSSGYVSAKY
jgi:hypothetical protein